MSKSMTGHNNGLIALLIPLALALQGCVVAAIPLAAASLGYSAFATYKVVQGQGGGDTEVRFKDAPIAPEDQALLHRIKRLAVWPNKSHASDTAMLAETLQARSRLDVITPYSVDKKLKAIDAEISEYMSESEKIAVLKRLGSELETDGILIIDTEGTSVDASFFKVSASESVQHFSVKIYSASEDRYIWKEEFQVATTFGAEQKDTKEVHQAAISAIADVVIKVCGKKKPEAVPST